VVDNIKMGLKLTEGVDWIHLAQNGIHLWDIVNTIMNLPGPYKANNFLSS